MKLALVRISLPFTGEVACVESLPTKSTALDKMAQEDGYADFTNNRAKGPVVYGGDEERGRESAQRACIAKLDVPFLFYVSPRC